jgi:hypothetical protein
MTERGGTILRNQSAKSITAIASESKNYSDIRTAKPLRIYTHVTEKSLQKIKSPFDDL